MGSPIDVSGFGKLSVAPDANALLLVVFGGIVVDNRASGVYMWDYMSRIQNRFHIFVAIDHKVDGTKAYESLMTTIGTQSLTPSQQILYLFSGGYKPGRHVLIDKGADTFSSIYLVDIWMGVSDEQHSIIPDFYKHLVNANRKKITYVYTIGGANNPEARDSIAKTLGSQNAILVNSQKGDKGLDTHMRTNTVAVGMLP